MNDTVDDPRMRILEEKVLSDDWATLTKYTIDYRRNDGARETLIRQVYDRGNGACILPYDPDRGTVLLVRQFRMPVWVESGGAASELIEACAGLLDDLDPETAIRREAEEELGYRLGPIHRILDCYMSPGSVSERIVFFTARYAPQDRKFSGGGKEEEGEDIEVLEPTLDEALEMVRDGRIRDGKTIMLLWHVKLHGVG
ncbi:MAG: NUDIX domain-containing protein [Rhizobiales bacterium]|nr:NUDIX domain-containing protein [Hyphomicrobiales bacterium]